MIQANISSLKLKVWLVQTSLTYLFDLERISPPIFKRNEKYCKNSDKEIDHFQTVLVKNTGFNMCDNENNIYKLFKN
jgi:hypothetical protein